MDRPPGTVRSRVASGVAKLRARRAAGRQSGINNTVGIFSFQLGRIPAARDFTGIHIAEVTLLWIAIDMV